MTNPFNWRQTPSTLAADFAKRKPGAPSTLEPRRYHDFILAGNAKPKEAK